MEGAGTLVTGGEGQKWRLMTPLAYTARALECYCLWAEVYRRVVLGELQELSGTSGGMTDSVCQRRKMKGLTSGTLTQRLLYC
ncbi:hypothetical protein E2C01_100244 [Portunus trituberculatus]|uniref:Uncharacterized protein n=1 Tax=Portunus trituberculatus TaxID=210409 RepID=A0A5B7KBI3_PORTR|nr:hypothetical protein [Portunus trituberculatus]